VIETAHPASFKKLTEIYLKLRVLSQAAFIRCINFRRNDQPAEVFYMKDGDPVSKWINRHAMMRKHKKHLKKKYGYGLWADDYYTNQKLHEQKCCQEGYWRRGKRNGGYEYWKTCYLSGVRRFAKNSTNRVIRAKYRDLLNGVDIENADDVQALTGSDYEKMFDYWWTVF